MTVSTNPFFEDDDFFFPPPDPPQQDPLMGLKGPPPSNGTASDIPVVSQLSQGNDTHAGVSETEVVDLCSVDGDGPGVRARPKFDSVMKESLRRLCIWKVLQEQHEREQQQQQQQDYHGLLLLRRTS